MHTCGHLDLTSRLCPYPPYKQLPFGHTVSPWEYEHELWEETVQTPEVGQGLLGHGILGSWISRAWGSTKGHIPLALLTPPPWRAWSEKVSVQDPP